MGLKYANKYLTHAYTECSKHQGTIWLCTRDIDKASTEGVQIGNFVIYKCLHKSYHIY